MRAAGYVRVSTDRQATEGWSLGEQEVRVRGYIESRGWELADVFVEAGVSGRRDDRPELGRLLALLGELDVVVVAKLDRLGRSTAHLWRLYGQLEAAGVALVSIGDGFDTSTANGKLLRSVLSAVAELEADTISERVRVGLAARAREGRWHGGAAPYGYRSVEGGLVAVADEAREVRRIFVDFVEGRSQASIARELNRRGVPSARGGHWAQPLVGRMLRKGIYAGQVSYGGDVVDGVHEAIVEVELFDRAQALLGAAGAATGRGRGRPVAGRHLFRCGLLRCGRCGESMTPRTIRRPGRRVYEAYECRRHLRDRESCARGPVARELIDSAVYDYFEHVALDVDATRAVIVERISADRCDVAEQLARAERDTAERETALSRVEADYLAGELGGSNYERLRAQLLDELAALTSEVDRLRSRYETLDARNRDAAEAADAALMPLAELRATIAAELRAPGRVEGVRAALARLFESFTLCDAGAAVPGVVEADLELRGAPSFGPALWLEPRPRAGAIEAVAALPWEDHERPSYTVVDYKLKRVPLPGAALGDNDTAGLPSSALPSGIQSR